MNSEPRWYLYHRLLLVMAIGVLILVWASLCTSDTPKYLETPEEYPATPPDTTWMPPAPVAKHCDGPHCIEKGPVDWYAEVESR